jgi:pimeloyl-ACP methyl ester carboxylesterase
MIVAALSGCVFSKLEDDLDKLEQFAHSFSGTLTADGENSDAIVVMALRDLNGDEIAGYRVVSGPGKFKIRTDRQGIYLFAFDDTNKDFRFQADEPYGWAESGQLVDPDIRPTDSLAITLRYSADNRLPLPKQVVDEPLENHFDDNMNFNVGTLTSLDNPWFSEEQASKGLWQPFAFMEDGGAGIHFLQPYDPSKIPVLFVHGINGTPRNFADLIERLDRSRYQPWIYSYPSGLRISQLSSGFFQFMEALHARYHFDEVHVVAHSMGGLVSRGGLNMCREANTCEYLRSYTTVSTPWDGVASAKSGIEWAPTVVPVWLDIDPDSEFVSTLFDTPLPTDLPFHLMFGYRQSGIFGSDSSDGVIKLSSQLRDEAQAQTRLVRGFDEDHMSILSNDRMARTIFSILERTSK